MGLWCSKPQTTAVADSRAGSHGSRGQLKPLSSKNLSQRGGMDHPAGGGGAHGDEDEDEDDDVGPRFSKSLSPAACWLRELGLSQYTQAFQQAGYSDWELLGLLEENDLQMIELHGNLLILPGHRKKLLLASRQMGQTRPARGSRRQLAHSRSLHARHKSSAAQLLLAPHRITPLYMTTRSLSQPVTPRGPSREMLELLPCSRHALASRSPSAGLLALATANASGGGSAINNPINNPSHGCASIASHAHALGGPSQRASPSQQLLWPGSETPPTDVLATPPASPEARSAGSLGGEWAARDSGGWQAGGSGGADRGGGDGEEAGALGGIGGGGSAGAALGRAALPHPKALDGASTSAPHRYSPSTRLHTPEQYMASGGGGDEGGGARGRAAAGGPPLAPSSSSPPAAQPVTLRPGCTRPHSAHAACVSSAPLAAPCLANSPAPHSWDETAPPGVPGASGVLPEGSTGLGVSFASSGSRFHPHITLTGHVLLERCGSAGCASVAAAGGAAPHTEAAAWGWSVDHGLGGSGGLLGVGSTAAAGAGGLVLSPASAAPASRVSSSTSSMCPEPDLAVGVLAAQQQQQPLRRQWAGGAASWVPVTEGWALGSGGGWLPQLAHHPDAASPAASSSSGHRVKAPQSRGSKSHAADAPLLPRLRPAPASCLCGGGSSISGSGSTGPWASGQQQQQELVMELLRNKAQAPWALRHVSLQAAAPPGPQARVAGGARHSNPAQQQRQQQQGGWQVQNTPPLLPVLPGSAAPTHPSGDSNAWAAQAGPRPCPTALLPAVAATATPARSASATLWGPTSGLPVVAPPGHYAHPVPATASTAVMDAAPPPQVLWMSGSMGSTGGMRPWSAPSTTAQPVATAAAVGDAPLVAAPLAATAAALHGAAVGLQAAAGGGSAQGAPRATAQQGAVVQPSQGGRGPLGAGALGEGSWASASSPATPSPSRKLKAGGLAGRTQLQQRLSACLPAAATPLSLSLRASAVAPSAPGRSGSAPWAATPDASTHGGSGASWESPTAVAVPAAAAAAIGAGTGLAGGPEIRAAASALPMRPRSSKGHVLLSKVQAILADLVRITASSEQQQQQLAQQTLQQSLVLAQRMAAQRDELQRLHQELEARLSQQQQQQEEQREQGAAAPPPTAAPSTRPWVVPAQPQPSQSALPTTAPPASSAMQADRPSGVARAGAAAQHGGGTDPSAALADVERHIKAQLAVLAALLQEDPRMLQHCGSPTARGDGGEPGGAACALSSSSGSTPGSWDHAAPLQGGARAGADADKLLGLLAPRADAMWPISSQRLASTQASHSDEVTTVTSIALVPGSDVGGERGVGRMGLMERMEAAVGREGTCGGAAVDMRALRGQVLAVLGSRKRQRAQQQQRGGPVGAQELEGLWRENHVCQLWPGGPSSPDKAAGHARAGRQTTPVPRPLAVCTPGRLELAPMPSSGPNAAGAVAGLTGSPGKVASLGGATAVQLQDIEQRIQARIQALGQGL